MLGVYDCIVFQHDRRLLVLAAVICLIASFTAISLLHHVERSSGRVRSIWLCVAGITTGFGVWATHFIAMLAYEPGIPSGYNVALTLVSLLAVIILTILAFLIASSNRNLLMRSVAGGVVGAGIAVMHYTGMAALEMPGRMIWDPGLVVLSIILGVVFGNVALAIGLRKDNYPSRIMGGALLAVATCAHHVTGMASATLILDPSIVISSRAIPTYWLAIMVAISCLVIFLIAFVGCVIDLRARGAALRETERLNSLAEAAFEGLVVFQGECITTANSSLAHLVGVSPKELIGCELSMILPDVLARRWLVEKPFVCYETVLLPLDGGEAIAVDVISRPILYASEAQTVVAVRDLRERKKAEKDIHYLAHHDTLTGLANRNMFNQELQRLILAHRPGERYEGRLLAVFCLDLDKFKEVNDLFGHGTGDDLLRSLALCSQKVLRKEQIMARLGGDEFAILAPGLREPQQAERIAAELLNAFQEWNTKSAASGALLSSSIGIAFYPLDADNGTLLMTCADTALYQAKAHGRGICRLFDAAMGEQMRDRRRLEHDLRFAIARHELSLVYQPLVRTRSREIFGFEALVRWHHGERGAIGPGTFIPLAEDSGLILPIGEWVLREACREAVEWAQPLTVAVNVSAVQLHNPKFVERCRDILNQTGLPPSRLELEITETALIRDPASALMALRQLKALGVRIAMDDFGTGYSSLSTLRTFPFDKIKIDASFIQSVHTNEQAATIVRAVLGLAKGLALPVLAEGVETEEELAFLRAEQCSEAQGNLLGRPQVIDKFRHLVAAEAV
ncbi:EAL domain-containing protein [Pseudomonas guariconensis]|uniref:bifunctional diguanylate cyclase/phosphodiesterase n=1 Tax=Pseudomonas guariconensis TaxID=1288410 RepID=UPI0018ABB8FB|nr:EAL domain-containing protein [Pseudomonas guariconensis]MBF8740614.1 EAL domain-containing protein [Pseudomonas guariconensis]MBF8749794.1 EAL domain-containing protein [Pseudomonas guariconensis]